MPYPAGCEINTVQQGQFQLNVLRKMSLCSILCRLIEPLRMPPPHHCSIWKWVFELQSFISQTIIFFFLIHLFGKSPSFQPEMKAWPCLGTRWGFSAPNPGWRKMLPFGPEGNMWLSIASSGECSGSLFSSKSCFWVRPLPAQLWAKQEPICRHSNPRTDCTREPCQGEFCEGQPKNWGVHSESAALSAFSGIYPKHFSRQTAKICHLKWFTMLMK